MTGTGDDDDRIDAADRAAARRHHLARHDGRRGSASGRTGAGPRDRAMTGLDWFSLEVTDPAMLATQRERVTRAGYAPTTVSRGFESTDPKGMRLRLVEV